jgi:hypothetical protein
LSLTCAQVVEESIFTEAQVGVTDYVKTKGVVKSGDRTEINSVRVQQEEIITKRVKKDCILIVCFSPFLITFLFT